MQQFMKNITLLLLLFFSCLYSTTIKAELPYKNIRIEFLNRKNGLDNNAISSILKDRNGFLWLGTDIGLSRYDGVTFHNFNIVENEPYNISTLFETENNMLWGWAQNVQRIVCLNTSNNQLLDVFGTNKKPMENISNFCVVKECLFAIKDSTLTKLSPSFSKDHVIINTSTIDNLGNVHKIFPSETHLIIPTADNQVKLYQPDTEQITIVDCSNLPINDILQIKNIQYFNHHLWLYDINNGLFCFNTENRTWRQLSDEPFYQMQAIDSKTFVLGSWDCLKICQFEDEDITSSSFKVLWETKETSVFIQNIKNQINALSFDSPNNVLWIGTPGGLVQLNFQHPSITNITCDSRIKRPTALLQDAQGHIWLTTQQKGIYRSTSSLIDEHLNFELWEESDSKGQYCMHKDRFENIWFGKYGNSLIKHNPIRKTSATIVIKSDKFKIPENIGKINHLYYNSRNRLWIASEKGLVVYDHESEKILDFIPTNPEQGMATAICEDGNGTMWIGFERGLFKIETYEDKYSKFFGGYEESAGLTPNKVTALYLNSYNQIFATYDDKIILIDGKTKNVITSNVLNENLSGGKIKCVIDDRGGNTWLGTQSGILTINNHNMKSYQYELPQNYYDVIQLHNNQLLWANSNGLTLFHPEQIKRNLFKKRFQISCIEINEHKQKVLLDNNETLSLPYDQNHVTVFVTDMLYTNIASQIEYRLLPKTSTWSESYHHFVELKGLEPGKYTLEIRQPKLTNEEPETTSLDIEIKKHWHITWKALIVYLIGIALIVCLILKFPRKRRSAVEESQEQAIPVKEEAKEEEIEATTTTTETNNTPIEEIIKEEKPESKLKVLIIEDHADIRLYLKVMFAKTYQVLLASNGQEGIDIALQEIPDLIITDVAMPVMDGFECCRLLKENLKTCHIPIIILTAMTNDESIVRGTELGADDYIMKPFNPEILRSKVKNLIKSRTELKKAYTKFLTNQTFKESEEGIQAAKEQDIFIKQILEIVEANMQNPEFSVKKLADLLNTSQPTLYRKVKQQTGYTIIELIRGVRLKRAAELLLSKKYNIQEVAEIVGYNDLATFRKHFSDHYGTTPSNYNKE